MPTSPGPLSAALETIWDEIRRDHADLLPATIAVGAGKRTTNHGPERWSAVDGRLTGCVVPLATLEAGADAVLHFLLHDSAHAINWARGIKDTTTRGRYHTKAFVDAAQTVGLRLESSEYTPQTGWTDFSVPPETAERYAPLMPALREAIDVALPALTVPTARARRTERVSVKCHCAPARTIYVGKTILAQGPIVCGVCGGVFE
ncbi:hypothetical protein HEK616_40840 [Streptomyces nigrescens]|uniref:SprT-like domain-containing protein n=1 Tax=Streptomyces nigrescens TaxID=1920 RepID=A0ABM7ZW64_STRNI|nr:hypothetical protein [Streptomyces nigrescens]BDM70597.1 hypothetical protein HEK616_40840 [Streptomyces nigrescens]